MTQIYEKERELHREVAETVQERLPDVDVLAVELAGPDRVAVYIDHPGGVDHALCERVTGALRGYLDRYSLEVSSPGLERPVRRRAHFEGALGRRVSVRTQSEIGGRKRFRGEVVAAGDGEVTLETGEGRVDVPYGEIVRGNLIEEGR
jgi:ribosome maturation factor RimP